MRLRNLVKGELFCLHKYGIFLLYFVLTILYLCVLSVVPEKGREITAIILVYADPTAMGLFFMGAVVLLEKSQRIDSALGVSPIRVEEYILSKVLPFVLVGEVVSFVLCGFAGMKNIVSIFVGVFLASFLFSLCGLLVGTQIFSLNGFIIATIPFEIFFCIPAIYSLFIKEKSIFWYLHPGVATISLINAKEESRIISIVCLVVWIFLLYPFCYKKVYQYLKQMKGGNL